MIPKALFSFHHLFDACLNPAYKSTIDENRQYFYTDRYINGEYFRLRTDNQYFCFVQKNNVFVEIKERNPEFRPLEDLISIYDITEIPEDKVLVRLEFTNNKEYFIEGYQAITVENPDFTIFQNVSLEEIRKTTPKFVPVPDGYPRSPSPKIVIYSLMKLFC
jgi:hypothetical protein